MSDLQPLQLVLAVTSQYFQDVLYCSREAVQTVKMTDIDHSVMMKYISYIYTGNIDMPSTEDIWKLLRSSNFQSVRTSSDCGSCFRLSRRVKHLGLAKLCECFIVKVLSCDERVSTVLNPNIPVRETGECPGRAGWSGAGRRGSRAGDRGGMLEVS